MGIILPMENQVPFGRAIHTWLYLHDQHLNALVRHDQMEAHYLAWETVRKELNPFFQKGTGFEGYLVGSCPSSEAAMEAILGISQNILDAIARMYKYRYNFRTRLMSTLTRETYDPMAVHIWSSYFGAELGKLRAQMLLNNEAQNFRQQTYKVISTLPPMVYHENDYSVTQTYWIGAETSSNQGKLFVTPQILNPSQRDAWLVAENIGEFGHPLVRKLLDAE